MADGENNTSAEDETKYVTTVCMFMKIVQMLADEKQYENVASSENTGNTDDTENQKITEV